MSAPSEWVDNSLPYVRPRNVGDGDALTEEARRQRRKASNVIREVAEVTPPTEIAAALNLADGEKTVVRRRLVLLDDRPTELADSYYPASFAVDTALAEPGKIRGGAPTLLADLGFLPDRVVEDLVFRPAIDSESDVLGIERGRPVAVLSRVVFDAAGRPFEASVMTIIPEGRRFHYEYKADSHG